MSSLNEVQAGTSVIAWSACRIGHCRSVNRRSGYWRFHEPGTPDLLLLAIALLWRRLRIDEVDVEGRVLAAHDVHAQARCIGALVVGGDFRQLREPVIGIAEVDSSGT